MARVGRIEKPKAYVGDEGVVPLGFIHAAMYLVLTSYTRVIRFNSATSSEDRRSPAAATFSRKWLTDAVPGIRRMFGER